MTKRLLLLIIPCFLTAAVLFFVSGPRFIAETQNELSSLAEDIDGATVLGEATVSSPSGEQALVKRVIDGDTIELENGDKVRYIGINTPEIHHPTKGVECFGQEAFKKNQELVEGKIVTLEKDISETDRYGRLLRYVWIDGVFINRQLVNEGFASASTFPPDVKYESEFQIAEQEARATNQGLWSVCL